MILREPYTRFEKRSKLTLLSLCGGALATWVPSYLEHLNSCPAFWYPLTHKHLRTPPYSFQMTAITESVEFFQTMLLSNGQDLYPGSLTNQELLGDPMGGATLEVNVGYNQESPAFDRGDLGGDEASRPWYFDHSCAVVAVLPVDVQFGPQSNMPPYEASSANLLEVWCILTYPRPNPAELERM
jgi:hypothetical protein